MTKTDRISHPNADRWRYWYIVITAGLMVLFCLALLPATVAAQGRLVLQFPLNLDECQTSKYGLEGCPLTQHQGVYGSNEKMFPTYRHSGLDFRTRIGSNKVYPVGAGYLIEMSRPSGFGRTIILEHSDGAYYSQYSHLDSYAELEKKIDECFKSVCAECNQSVTTQYKLDLCNAKNNRIRVGRGDVLGVPGGDGGYPEHLHLEVNSYGTIARKVPGTEVQVTTETYLRKDPDSTAANHIKKNETNVTIAANTKVRVIRARRAQNILDTCRTWYEVEYKSHIDKSLTGWACGDNLGDSPGCLGGYTEKHVYPTTDCGQVDLIQGVEWRLRSSTSQSFIPQPHFSGPTVASVTKDGVGSSFRWLPMPGISEGEFGDLVIIGKAVHEEKFQVIGEFQKATQYPKCDQGWVQIAKVDGAPFEYKLFGGTPRQSETKEIPSAWMCRGSGGERWLEVEGPTVRPTPEPSPAEALVAIIIDVSGSMNGIVALVDHENLTKRETKLDVAKNATRSLAVITSQGSAANSLSTFSQDGSTIVHMGSGSDHLDRFEVAVNGLRAGGGTNIGAGLEQGFMQLATGGSGCAVLMSDGQNTAGSFDAAVGRFSSAGIPIYTVGFGEEAGRAELLGIARETGGTFWLAGAMNLGSVFLDSGSLCTNTSTTKRVTETMGPGSEVEYTMLVQEGVNEIGGHATWQGSMLGVIMVDPRGRQIPSSALPAQDGQASTGSNYLVFSKRNPEPGMWRLKFFWSDPPPVAEQVNIALTERSDLVMALVGIENEYAVGEPVQVALLTGEVIGQERVPLQDPRMRVRVQKPGSQVTDVVRARSRNLQLLERVVDAATVTIEVHDDGQHEDYHPGDGIFGAVFTDTHEPGVYLIRAEVSGRKSDGSWVQREITATFQVGPLAANPVTAASVLEAVDLLSRRQDPLRAIDAVRSGQIRTAPAPLPRPSMAPKPVLQVRPPQPSLPLQSDPFTQIQPRPSQTGPASAIERLRARD